MGANLVIVESPAKAKTIEKFLGEDYKVKASKGHVRDLPADKLGIDIQDAFEPQYIIPADKKKTIDDLKAAARNAEMVWLASDEDREGEAIAWHLYETLGLKPENTRRIVFHEITKNAILNAVENPRDIDMSLVKAQQARRVLDRLVGYELSPVLWKKIKSGLSAGRVQSVAVRLIVDREREINAFNSQCYYKVEGIFTTKDEGTAVKAVLDRKFTSEEEALAFLEKCKEANFMVADVEKKEGTRSPAAPFTTSQLQQEAARKLGFSVNQTMSTAQRLYEAGLITYMRTDSTNLSSLAINTAKETICGLYGEKYSKVRNYKTKAKGAQEAHEAIRPTYISNTAIEGTSYEKRLYELIWKRTIASQMADARVEKTSITIAGDNFEEKFIAHGEKILFDGFLKVYMESTDDEESEEALSLLPRLTVGMLLNNGETRATESFTQCPARYSEASLVKKMEELGIGRPSTYAPTIKTIIDRGYIIKGDKPAGERTIRILSLKDGRISTSTKKEMCGSEKKKLFPENIGMAVTDYLTKSFSGIMDYGFTAKVEEDFDKIAEGKKGWSKMIDEFYSSFHKMVEDSLVERAQKTERELGTDPATGKPVFARIARYGAIVQLGANDDADKKFASLEKGQLIESVTLAEALRLLQLPRLVGKFGQTDIIAAIGSRGPYIKYHDDASGKDKYVSIPKELNPYDINEAEANKLIADDAAKAANRGPIAEFKEQDIQILNGIYGPYIKHAGANYRIPKGTDPASITAEAAMGIIAKAGERPARRASFKKKKTK
ncbi:MAG: type I DNA topoisomerase [Bacteroidales bacterium]|nr:type I DNA topoisomerase [Bacteroidales bacterium]